MREKLICVENLGKRYRLRQPAAPRYTALRDVVAERAKRFLKPRSSGPWPATEDFWALRDVSFSLARGEVLGVIGRNGAGKSTLLKILSRITEPTEGRVTLRGRVASLLEVGTGFHPELTGRENIFLNGAILGLSKAEILKRFDEMVAFAEAGPFLDMPVKHYSSGMQMRLAFSVAAHLDPEILVVDEVLAVGDAEFQKKCLGKMESVTSAAGRAVVFVSHNLDAVSRLAQHCIVLHGGRVAFMGPTSEAVAFHQKAASTRSGDWRQARPPDRTGKAAIQRIWFCDEAGVEKSSFLPGQTILACFEVEAAGAGGLDCEVAFAIETLRERAVMSTHASDCGLKLRLQDSQRLQARITPNILRRGGYLISAGIYSRDFLEKHDELLHVAAFTVAGDSPDQPDDNRWGEVYLPLRWQVMESSALSGPAS